MVRRFHIVFLAVLMMVSCSSRALHEAQGVVAQADSMRAEGRMYDDSLALAQAYGTLGQWSWFHADEYAHSCYHYGRLLREKDNPVEAMQCFINASHTPTRDYHILGRVYSNMGSICHLASDFPLSYEMYEHSADMFLRAGDSIAYFYALNDMAFEMAEQGLKRETLGLLAEIEQCIANPKMVSKTWETKARLYLCVQQYDSVIYSVKHMGDNATGLILNAQAYWHMDKLDSALFYAKRVVYSPYTSDQDRYNALYIVLNYDSTLQNDDIIALSAQRSDIETDVLIPLHNRWAVAVQLLEQDLTRKPNLLWLYAIIATLSIVGLIIGLYIWHKRKKHALLVQKIDDLEHAASTVREKHQALSNLYASNQNRIKEDILSKCNLLRKSSNVPKELSWNNFESMCKVVDQRFYMLASKLRQKHILNETEIRLCILVFLNMSRSEISDTLPYALNSVGKLKDHTAKLLGTTGRNLHDFLLNMAIQG